MRPLPPPRMPNSITSVVNASTTPYAQTHTSHPNPSREDENSVKLVLILVNGRGVKIPLTASHGVAPRVAGLRLLYGAFDPIAQRYAFFCIHPTRYGLIFFQHVGIALSLSYLYFTFFVRLHLPKQPNVVAHERCNHHRALPAIHAVAVAGVGPHQQQYCAQQQHCGINQRYRAKR